MRQLSKRNLLLLLLIMCVSFASAEKKEIITLKQGDPLILLQKKKTAIFEIDYSQMVVTDGKNHEDDIPFYEWMKIQDEDNDKWTEDWESKDKEKCYKAFRDNFNSELKNGLKLTKLGKNYKAIFRINQINFGNAVRYTVMWGLRKGISKASGSFEVRDINTDEVKLILDFKDLKGEGSFKQIGRLIGIFENFGEQLNEFLEEYQEEYEKQQKEQEKLRKKELKKAEKNKE